jgi:prepilin peptidase CpaA
VFGAAVRLSDGASALAWSVAVAALVFLLLAILHARGLLGGGDAKLAAATCLGLSPIAAYQFIFSTTMAGGMLALLHLVLRRSVRGTKPWPPPCRGTALPRRMVCAERWRIARHGSLPYAVAIACGGLWVILTGNGG